MKLYSFALHIVYCLYLCHLHGENVYESKACAWIETNRSYGALESTTSIYVNSDVYKAIFLWYFDEKNEFFDNFAFSIIIIIFIESHRNFAIKIFDWRVMWKLAQIHFHQGSSIIPMKCFTTAHYKLSGDKTEFSFAERMNRISFTWFCSNIWPKMHIIFDCSLSNSAFIFGRFSLCYKQWSLILMMLTSDPYYLLIFYSTTKLSSSFHLMDVFLHEFLSVDFSSIVRSSDELLLFLWYLLHRLIDCFGAFFSSLVNFLPFSSSYARLLLWATHMLIQIVIVPVFFPSYRLPS